MDADAGVILHVDDERPIREALSILLGTSGYRVVGAASCAEAMQAAAQGLRPDLMIIDFNLGEESNGADLIERIRHVFGYTPPTIMLTGNPYDAEAPWVIDAPLWLARKPLDPELLLAAVPSLVQLSRAIRALQMESSRGGHLGRRQPQGPPAAQ
jgi:DNA-binding response OmpR family regulator